MPTEDWSFYIVPPWLRKLEENEVLKYRNAELEQYIERIENVAHWEGGRSDVGL